ncbi:MAG: serine hydrolase domain-containing protein [Sphingorhabdus sp.]|uniref:serine hydrolase domain-containing protein n=1 Tax=Sphingorhabdus sp. TaxID=1902408 RepID=UPI0038FCEA26
MIRLLAFISNLLSALLGMLAAGLLAASPAQANEADWAALDRLVDSHQAPGEPGVSIAVSVGGRLVYERWAGQADLERAVPIGADTRFHIGSISKQFTAFAIVLLAEEGKLSLDQDVRDFIPELEARPTPVTIRHLLNHTSGLREESGLLLLTGQTQASPVTADQALDLIFRQRSGNFTAGERQEYSNTGYQLLAEVTARVSGQPFAEFMQNRVFGPLGMTQSFVLTDPNRIIENIAASYDPADAGFAKAHLLSATYGSTGIVTHPRDLLLWAQALNSGEIGGTNVSGVVAAMAARFTLPNGRRLIATNGQEYRNFRGLDTWSHGGSTGGFRSFLLRVTDDQPGKQVAIAVIGNRSDFLKAAFAFDVAEIVLADQLEAEEIAEFVPEAGEQLDRYTGDYRLFAGVEFSLRRDGDALTFATFGEKGVPLPQIGKGVFMLNPSRELRLEFHDFEEGPLGAERATEMRWQVSKDGYIPAPRAAMQPVPQTPLDTDELIGTYYSDTLQQTLILYAQGGQLWLRTGDAKHVPFARYQPDTFRPEAETGFQRLEFTRDGGGSVKGLLVSAPLANDIEYRRIDGSNVNRP